MKKIFVIVLAVLLSGIISAKALEYFRGTPEEIMQVQNDVLGYEAINGNKVNTGGYFRENLLPLVNNTYDVGSSALKFKNGFFAGTLTTGGALTSGGNLLPDGNNTRDIGAYGTAWRDIFASGTIYGNISTSTLDNIVIGGSTRAAGNFTNLDFNGTGVLGDGGDDIAINSNDWDISSAGIATSLSISTSTLDNMTLGVVTPTRVSSTLLSVMNTLYIGGANTTTFTTGNRGLATSTLYSDLSILNRDVVIGGVSGSGWLYIGDGTATTSVRGGTAGSTTSTFEGDTVIANLFSGTNIFDTDAGMVDAMDLPVSSAAATGTLEGYNFPIDGKPLLTLSSQSDASGSVWAGYAGIGTQSPSSTLHIGPDFMGINNLASSSPVTIGTDRMSTGCIVMQNTAKTGWVGCMVAGTTFNCVTITSPSTCN